MIIDADTHISLYPQRGAIKAEELIRRMDRSGVDKAVTWLQPPYNRDIDALCKYVHDSVQQYPDRLLGFGWADPMLGAEHSKNIIKECVEEYGFYGIKVHGALNVMRIDDPEVCLPVIEEIAKTGKILALHSAADSYEETHPKRVARIAKLFPEMKIMLVHMGGVGWADLCLSAMEAAEECPNITLVGSAVRAVRILQAIKRVGPARVCFGSDTPFALMHVEKAMYEALMDGELTGEDKKKVMGGNIEGLFGLNPKP
jgi:predicted TIM-barrel fold metal-dependent hydrolase